MNRRTGSAATDPARRIGSDAIASRHAGMRRRAARARPGARRGGELRDVEAHRQRQLHRPSVEVGPPRREDPPRRVGVDEDVPFAGRGRVAGRPVRAAHQDEPSSRRGSAASRSSATARFVSGPSGHEVSSPAGPEPSRPCRSTAPPRSAAPAPGAPRSRAPSGRASRASSGAPSKRLLRGRAHRHVRRGRPAPAPPACSARPASAARCRRRRDRQEVHLRDAHANSRARPSSIPASTSRISGTGRAS